MLHWKLNEYTGEGITELKRRYRDIAIERIFGGWDERSVKEISVQEYHQIRDSIKIPACFIVQAKERKAITF